MGRISLIIGGARSGKSAYALELSSRARGRCAFVATAEALDEEMAARIARHRAERPAEFATIEAPVALAAALDEIGGSADVVIIDSLTLWVSNLMRNLSADAEFHREFDALADAMKRARFATVAVTDEVGSGIVPENPVARRFRDLLGSLNQAIAKAADEVTMVVAGYPLKVK